MRMIYMRKVKKNCISLGQVQSELRPGPPLWDQGKDAMSGMPPRQRPLTLCKMTRPFIQPCIKISWSSISF